MKKFLTFICCCAILSLTNVYSQQAATSDYLLQGLNAYQSGNWDTAILSFKKAILIPETNSQEVLYMLIMSEMFAGKYDDVLADSEDFYTLYPKSEYRKYIDYQKGRSLFYLERYSDSLKVFQDFCSKNEKDELFSSALFWTAESFYATYYLEDAKKIYERIISDFPNSIKYTEAVYRLDLITQRENEEKLLYLLKVTGEEYLSSKQNYERQIKQYETEESIGLRTQLRTSRNNEKALQASVSELKAENELLSKRLAELQEKYANLSTEKQTTSKEEYTKRLQELKEKASKIQEVIDSDILEEVKEEEVQVEEKTGESE